MTDRLFGRLPYAVRLVIENKARDMGPSCLRDFVSLELKVERPRGVKYASNLQAYGKGMATAILDEASVVRAKTEIYFRVISDASQ